MNQGEGGGKKSKQVAWHWHFEKGVFHKKGGARLRLTKTA